MTQTVVDETKKETQYDWELLEKVRGLLASGMLDQRTLAQRLSYSEATISMYLKGSYTGAVDKIERYLRRYLNMVNEAQDYKKVKLEFVKTTIAKKIYSIAKLCRFNGEMCVCYGASGLGKTTAIRNYAKKYTGVYIIDPHENASVRKVLQQLADNLGVIPASNTADDLTEAITKRLKDSGFLIIVDEAENLSTNVFRTLRKIHDQCEATIGLLFVGTEQLYFNMKRLRGDFVYITNRISHVEKIDHLNREDIKEIVEQVYPNCDELVLKAFEQCSGNNARVLFNILKRAKDIQITNKEEIINVAMIASARSMLLI